MNGGVGGAGESNAGTSATLTNSGKITGGGGGASIVGGGAGVSNASTITKLTNVGKISGGNGGGAGGSSTRGGFGRRCTQKRVCRTAERSRG